MTMNSKRLKNDQRGFVAITVALFIIALVTIITISFAYLIRKEQKEALDRQLSTQAYYAAESGVNDAVTALKAGTISDKISCSDMTGLNPTVNAVANVKYTCVLISQEPTSLIYDNRAKDTTQLVHVRSASNIGFITISWEDSDKDEAFASSGTHFYFPEKKYIDTPPGGDVNADFPNHTGLLRASITPAKEATSADNLLTRSQTLFLYPNGGGIGNYIPVGSTPTNSVNFRSGGQESQEGLFVDGQCNKDNKNPNSNKPRFCNVVVDVRGPTTNDFYIRLRPVYKKVSVTIKAYAPGDVNYVTPLPLRGSQAVIDATGKAQDVLRRIQVRVPLQDDYYYPEFALESMDTICKRFSTWPGGSSVAPPPDFIYNSTDTRSGGERNESSLDKSACMLPGQTDIPGWPANVGPKVNY